MALSSWGTCPPAAGSLEYSISERAGSRSWSSGASPDPAAGRGIPCEPGSRISGRAPSGQPREGAVRSPGATPEQGCPRGTTGRPSPPRRAEAHDPPERLLRGRSRLGEREAGHPPRPSRTPRAPSPVRCSIACSMCPSRSTSARALATSCSICRTSGEGERRQSVGRRGGEASLGASQLAVADLGIHFGVSQPATADLPIHSGAEGVAPPRSSSPVVALREGDRQGWSRSGARGGRAPPARSAEGGRADWATPRRPRSSALKSRSASTPPACRQQRRASLSSRSHSCSTRRRRISACWPRNMVQRWVASVSIAIRAHEL